MTIKRVLKRRNDVRLAGDVRLAVIGTRSIAVLPGPETVVAFSSGVHGKQERGNYCFWTLIGTDKYGDWRCIGRARRPLSPGDRFNRMYFAARDDKDAGARKAYAATFKRSAGASFIRPASLREVYAWALSHRKDWAFVTRIACGGKRYKQLPRGAHP